MDTNREPSWAQQLLAVAEQGREVRDVLQQFHAGHDVERFGALPGERVRVLLQVFDVECLFLGVCPGLLQRGAGQVKAGGVRARAGQGFGQQAAAAADVEHGLPGQFAMFFDVLEAGRVDCVQGLHRALRVPPVEVRAVELREFGRVLIEFSGHKFSMNWIQPLASAADFLLLRAFANASRAFSKLPSS